MENPIIQALRRIGLRFDGQFQFKFGAGVTSKTSGALMIIVPAIVLAAIFMPPDPAKALIIFGLIGLAVVYLVGTWIHTALNPHTALEGGHLVAWQTATLAAKGQPETTSLSAPVENPQYREITDNSGGSNDAE